MRRILIMPLLALAVTLTVASASAQTVPQDRTALTQSFAPLVEQVAPAVVNIYAKIMAEPRRTENSSMSVPPAM